MVVVCTVVYTLSLDLYVDSLVFMYLHCLDLSTFTALPEHGSLTKIGCNNYYIYGNQK